MSLKDIKKGDKVHIQPMTGFGDPSIQKVTSIKTRYSEKTGKPYKVICIGDHMFHARTGNALNSPTAYYIAGKAKMERKSRKDEKGYFHARTRIAQKGDHLRCRKCKMGIRGGQTYRTHYRSIDPQYTHYHYPDCPGYAKNRKK